MNPEMIHDALTLLPGDLILPVDKLRSRPVKRRSHWVRWTSLAACLALLLYSGFLFQSHFLSRSKTSESAAAPQEPYAQAPAAAAPDVPAANADTAAAEEAPEENAQIAASGTHRHSFAQEEPATEDSVTGYCGNTMVTIHIGDEVHTLSGSDAIAITDILINLRYDPEKVCPCPGEITVDTEITSGIEVNLTEGFARGEAGQADLTQAQAQTIRAILDTLEAAD